MISLFLNFYEKQSHLNGPLISINSLKIVDFKFLVTIDNDVSCHMTLGDFQK